MAIKFLRKYQVQDGPRTTYAKDEVRDDLSPESEKHFINRGVAVQVEKGEVPSPAVASKAPEGKAAPSRKTKGTKRAAK